MSFLRRSTTSLVANIRQITVKVVFIFENKKKNIFFRKKIFSKIKFQNVAQTQREAVKTVALGTAMHVRPSAQVKHLFFGESRDRKGKLRFSSRK